MSFFVNISLTGDCQNLNLGAATLNAISNPLQNNEPFFYTWLIPDLGTGQTKTNLSAGTYVVRVNDSTAPNNLETYVNLNISSGLCSYITSLTNTSCGLENGVITVNADTISQEVEFQLYRNDILYSIQTGLAQTTFINLPSGIYYILATDFGGCTAQTQNCIIQDSSLFDYGVFIVPESPCLAGSGKIFITGITPNDSYSYIWRDSQNNVISQTGSTITGLTAGVYNLTISSSDNCVRTTNISLPTASSLGGSFIDTINPTCFSANGEITFRVTGGTEPYFYSGNNGTVAVSYSNTFTFTGLSAGEFSVRVTDVSLCNYESSTTLLTPNTFIVTSVNITNSNCRSSDGRIDIELLGGSAPYTYILSGISGSQNITTNSTTQIFSNLSSGEYQLIISGSGSNCVFSENVSILSEPQFLVTTQVSGTTCAQNNGILTIGKTSGGTPPYLYQITGQQNLSILSSNSGVTFNNLQSGLYTVTVSTNDGCSVSTQTYLQEQPPLNFTLFNTDCGLGNEGTITAIITSGAAPFTLNWFPSISNTIYATGLTSGDYSLEIIDSNGCSDIKTITISCIPQYSSFRIFKICEKTMDIKTSNKFGLIEMLNFGFQDLTLGNTTCVLDSTEFIVSVTANSIVTSSVIYNGISLIDVPSDSLVYNTVKDLLIGTIGIGGVDISYENNRITILTDCSLNNEIDDMNITVELLILYNITCNDN